MLKHFGQLVIGGRTGKREQAWFVFLAWMGAFGWFTYKEALGVTMAGTQSILSLAFLPVLANLTVAYGMERLSAQSKWGGQP